MNLSIVVADLPVVSDLRVVGGTAECVVFESGGTQYACDRATGEPTSVPADVVATAPLDEVTVNGVRVFVRPTKRAVMRATGARQLQALALGELAQVALVPGIGALVVERGRTRLGGDALVPTIVGPAGPLTTIETLPVWVVNDKSSYDLDASIPWTLTTETTARVVVLSTPRRAVWLTFESIAALPSPQLDGVTVVPALEHEGSIDLFTLERHVWRREAAGEAVAGLVTKDVSARLAKLRALGVAPALDDEAIADIAAALTPTKLGSSTPIVTGSILAAHLATVDRDDVIADEARAARANAEARDERRFVTFLSQGDDAPFVAMSPATRKAAAKLVVLAEPELPPAVDVDDPETLARALAELAEIEVVVENRGGKLVVRLSLEAAGALADALPSR